MPTKVKKTADALHQEMYRRILSSVYEVGDRVPTEVELARTFGCSRTTVGKALARLEHDGLVERRTRAGTRVIRNRPLHEEIKPQLDAVAFIYPSEQHEGTRRIMQGFQEAAREAKRRTVTLTTGTNFRKEAEIIGRLGEFDVKGAVVYPVLPEPKDRLYFEQMLLSCRFPVVLTDVTLPGLECPAVVVDNFHAGYTMTRCLLDQGLRRIGFLTNHAWVPFAQNCYRGYCWAMEEVGVEKQPDWTLLEPSLHVDFEHPVEGSRALAKRFLENAHGLEGVVCGDDFHALACLALARELGIQVPGQLKVVGISDHTLSAQSTPSLTTYHVPYTEMGHQAFQMLTCLLRGEKLPKMETVVRGHLVVRQSSQTVK